MTEQAIWDFSKPGKVASPTIEKAHRKYRTTIRAKHPTFNFQHFRKFLPFKRLLAVYMCEFYLGL